MVLLLIAAELESFMIVNSCYAIYIDILVSFGLSVNARIVYSRQPGKAFFMWKTIVR